MGDVMTFYKDIKLVKAGKYKGVRWAREMLMAAIGRRLPVSLDEPVNMPVGYCTPTHFDSEEWLWGNMYVQDDIASKLVLEHGIAARFESMDYLRHDYLVSVTITRDALLLETKGFIGSVEPVEILPWRPPSHVEYGIMLGAVTISRHARDRVNTGTLNISCEDIVKTEKAARELSAVGGKPIPRPIPEHCRYCAAGVPIDMDRNGNDLYRHGGIEVCYAHRSLMESKYLVPTILESSIACLCGLVHVFSGPVPDHGRCDCGAEWCLDEDGNVAVMKLSPLPGDIDIEDVLQIDTTISVEVPNELARGTKTHGGYVLECKLTPVYPTKIIHVVDEDDEGYPNDEPGHDEVVPDTSKAPIRHRWLATIMTKGKLAVRGVVLNPVDFLTPIAWGNVSTTVQVGGK